MSAHVDGPSEHRHRPAAAPRPRRRAARLGPPLLGVLVALPAAALTALPAAAAGPVAPTGTADPAVSSSSTVLVVERTPASDEAERLVTSLGGVVRKQRPEAGGFEARLPPGTLATVRAASAVTSVQRLERDAVTGPSPCDAATDPACFDAQPETAIWQQAIGLDQIPGKLRGRGVTVAVLDTGVTPGPDLGTRLLARVDLTSGHDGVDRFGHGSAMTGIVAGDGTASLEQYTGVALDAGVVGVKVAGWDGATDVTTVIAGLHWVVANAARYGIRVVNLSFGTDAVAPVAGDPLDAAVEQVWRAGIVVVTSAGNAGAAGTVTTPGDDPFAVTVGAADTAGTADPSDDVVAAFSSRGPTPDGLGKPDLLAPGVGIVGLRAPGSTIDVFRPAARIAADYVRGSGTSQAAAVVSGVVARMLGANPALTPDQVKGILLATTDRTLAGKPGAGAGLVDAAAAVTLAAASATGATVPVANADAVPATGAGPLDVARGSQRVWADPDGDGAPTVLSGDVDALGRPWTPQQVTTPWSAATWAASPWSAATAEIPGSDPAPAWTGPRGAQVSWDPADLFASDAVAAGWDTKYWWTKYWVTKYWVTGSWQ